MDAEETAVNEFMPNVETVSDSPARIASPEKDVQMKNLDMVVGGPLSDMNFDSAFPPRPPVSSYHVERASIRNGSQRHGQPLASHSNTPVRAVHFHARGSEPYNTDVVGSHRRSSSSRGGSHTLRSSSSSPQPRTKDCGTPPPSTEGNLFVSEGTQWIGRPLPDAAGFVDSPSPKCKSRSSSTEEGREPPPTPTPKIPQLRAPQTIFRASHSMPETSSLAAMESKKSVSKDNYFIIKCIGSGSSAKAYRARNRETGEIVCVKEWKKPMRSENEMKRISKRMNEILAAVKDCPNIVRHNNAWVEDSTLFVETELCQGDLTSRLSDEPPLMNESRVWYYCYQIALGLERIHSNNLTHLDIKTENLFVCEGDVIKIGDFQFEYEDEEGDGRYIASFKEPLSSKRDIFSLGMVLFELVTGMPLQGKFAELREKPLPLHKTRFPVSNELKSFIQRLVSKYPEQRPSARDILSYGPCIAAFRAHRSADLMS